MCRPVSVMIAESQLETDVSQMTTSTISPGLSPRKQAVKELHFKLVFFDILLLDGRSLVHGAPARANLKTSLHLLTRLQSRMMCAATCWSGWFAPSMGSVNWPGAQESTSSGLGGKLNMYASHQGLSRFLI